MYLLITIDVSYHSISLFSSFSLCQKIMKRCRKIAGALGCSSSNAANVYSPHYNPGAGTSSQGAGTSTMPLLLPAMPPLLLAMPVGMRVVMMMRILRLTTRIMLMETMWMRSMCHKWKMHLQSHNHLRGPGDLTRTLSAQNFSRETGVLEELARKFGQRRMRTVQARGAGGSIVVAYGHVKL